MEDPSVTPLLAEGGEIMGVKRVRGRAMWGGAGEAQ